MRLLRFRRAALFVVGAGVVLAGSGLAASAQAQPIQPDYTCPNPSVCVFQGTNFDGYHWSYDTHAYADEWISLAAPPGDFNLPWGSVHNNSNSSVRFEDTSGNYICVFPNTKLAPPLLKNAARNYRYMYIEYGNTNCSANPPPP